MVNYFIRLLYKCYFFTFSNKWLDLKYHHVCIKLTNRFYPLLCSFSAPETLAGQDANNPYIVSFTSFPARIDKVWQVAESIFRQCFQPTRLILWLSTEDFESKELLPKKLLQLEKRGLEIRFCNNNLMPHKKYFYAMQEFPNATIITIDDDMIYPPDLLQKLITAQQQYPGSICCSICADIKISEGHFRPYDEWYYVKKNQAPSFRLLPIGAGAVLYPPGSLHKEVFNQPQLIKMALYTDDLWLKIMSLVNYTKVASIAGEYPRFFAPVLYKKTLRLMDLNIGQGQNDIVFNNLITRYHISTASIEEE